MSSAAVHLTIDAVSFSGIARLRCAMEPATADDAPPPTARKTVHIADDETHESASYIAGSGSDRIVVQYPRERRGPSSRRSVHSPAASSGSRSFSSASSDNSYVQVDVDEDEDEVDEEDDIEPSDSASRARQRHSRRHTTAARPPPTRRHSSRRIPHEEREELPRRPSPPRHRSSRHHHAESRRTPSDESSSVASLDDYPYGHHGVPPRAHYPPSGYRHVPAPGPHGGYPPSVISAPPYHDPFPPHNQALVAMPHPDGFGYPGQNPFSPHGPPQNPFSPISSVGGSSYFATDPHAPPPSMPPQRPHGPPRPQSYAAPSHYAQSGYGSDMAMAHYPPSAHPGMPPYPFNMPGYPHAPWPYPPSHTSSPAPGKAESDEPKIIVDEKASKEIEALKELIKKQEEVRIAAEKERIAKAEADAAAAAAKKAEEAAEERKKEEIAAASKKAKEDAEKKAEEAARQAKDEHEKKLAEAQQAKEEAEKKQKELEAEMEKSKPMPDMLKPPIKFKDAVGRKFSFPWHLCKTWKGMEGLIRQAFMHVDIIGDHVRAQHYDLTGPDGEIILPQVWDTMVQPDWEISMHMWPMPEESKKEDKAAADVVDLSDPFVSLGLGDLGLLDVSKPPKKKRDGKSKKAKGSLPDVIDVASAPMPPPPNFPPGVIPDLFPPDHPPMVEEKKTRPKAKSKGGKDISPWAAWMVGAPVRSKKDDEKLGLARQKTTHSSSSGEQTSCSVM